MKILANSVYMRPFFFPLAPLLGSCFDRILMIVFTNAIFLEAANTK